MKKFLFVVMALSAIVINQNQVFAQCGVNPVADLTICDSPVLLTASDPGTTFSGTGVYYSGGGPGTNIYCTYDAGGGSCGGFSGNLCSDGYNYLSGPASVNQPIVEGGVTSIVIEVYYTDCWGGGTNLLLNGTQVYTNGGNPQECSCTPSTYPTTYTLSGGDLAPLTGGGSDYLDVQFPSGIALAGIRVTVNYTQPAGYYFDPAVAGAGTWLITGSCGAGNEDIYINVIGIPDPCVNVIGLTCGLDEFVSLATSNGCNSAWSYTGCWQGLGEEQLYQYTAPSNGIYNINVTSSNYVDYTEFYYKDASGGCGNYGFTCLGSWYGTGQVASLTLTGGTTYYFLIDRTDYYTGGAHDMTWNLSCALPDPCSNIQTYSACDNVQSTTLNYGSYSWTGQACGWTSGGEEIIYQFTPSVSGSYNLVNTYHNGGDYVPVSYRDASTGCGNDYAWSCIGIIYPYYGYPTTVGTMTLNAGSTYYFLFDRENSWSGSPMQFDWKISCPCAAIDPCTTIQSISSCGTTNYATLSDCGAWNQYDPYIGNYAYGQENIFTYTPSVTGNYSINVTNYTYNVDYIDWTYKDASLGCDANNWLDITDSWGTGIYGSFNMNAGTTYYIMCDKTNYNGAFTTTLDWNLVCPPDPCANILALSGCGINETTYLAANGAWNYESCGAYGQGGEQIYTFTPSVTGTYNLSDWTQYDDARSWSYKDVSLGCDQNNWTCIATDSWLSYGLIGSVSLNAGTTYYILCDKENDWTGGGSSCTWSLDCPCAATDPCTYIQTINNCGDNQNMTLGGCGYWNQYDPYIGNYAYGSEQIYTYAVAVSGYYSINVTNYTNNVDYIDWTYKDVSMGCDQNNWLDITDSWGTGSFGSFYLNAGSTYYIMADKTNYNGSFTTTLDWNLSCPAPDPCTTIITIANCGDSHSVSLNDGGAWDYSAGCWQGLGAEQLYQYTPPISGTYLLNCSYYYSYTGIDYTEFAYKDASGGCGNYGWSCINYVNYAAGVFGSVTLNAGTTYYFLVDRTDYWTGGTNDLTWELLCPPDPCANIQSFPGCGITVSTTQTSAGAWNYDACGAYGAGSEQIYTFTPSASGIYNLWDQTYYDDSRSWSYKDASLGCDQYNWTCIGTDSWNTCCADYLVGTATLNAGTTYYIMVEKENDWSGGTSTCNWYLECPPQPPVITSISPTSGCGGSTPIIISGSGFTDATNVDVGGTPVQSYIVDNDNQITAVASPFGTTGPITVVTPSGSFTSADTYTVGLPPQITYCPPAVSIDLPAGVCEALMTYDDATAIGDAPVTITYSQASGTMFPKGINVVTVTATNSCGSATCYFTVSVNDVTPPVIAGCPSDIVVDNDPGMCSAVVSWADPTVTDDCPTAGVGTGSTTFGYTGGMQTYVVPSGVTEITVDMVGAAGGAGGGLYYNPTQNQGGFGGSIQGSISVSSGQVIEVYVGGAGQDGNSGGGAGGGFNGGGNGFYWLGSYWGGGGGGASDIRIGGSTLVDRKFVAAGGGGGGFDYFACCNYERGGDGGDLNGDDGFYAQSQGHPYAGGGGTQTSGGIGGDYAGWGVGDDGQFGIGGNAPTNGYYGYGNNDGGGGGAGWFGGGGGSFGGGGGGSSYADPSASGVVTVAGVNSGNGYVIISYDDPPTPTIIQIAGPPSGSTFPIGTTTITYEATDGMNLTYCSFDVIVNDTEVPTFTYCPIDITVTAPTGQCDAVVTFADPTAEDNCSTVSGSQTFTYINGTEFFTVPNGVTEITVDLVGAGGGAGGWPTNYTQNQGGLGGQVQGTIAVTPGQTIEIYVGGRGEDGSPAGGAGGGFNGGGDGYYWGPGSYWGGGGGGASDIRIGGSTLVDRMLVAGGGGGGGFDYFACCNQERGGNGGDLNGEAGSYGSVVGYPYAGGGGTQTSGGIGGNYSGWGVGDDGQFGIGGNAPTNGYYGYGVNDGGGGGGGWFGGGGGSFGGGGGGSGYADPSVSAVVHAAGVNSSDGYAILSWNAVVVTVVQTTGLPSGSTFPVGTTINTFEATDLAGNTAQCIFNVTVLEATPPTLTACPADIISNVPIVFWTPPIAADNCPGVVLTSNYNPGDTFPLGTTVVTYTATDASGNSVSCSFNVTYILVGNGPINDPCVNAISMIFSDYDLGISTISCVAISGTTVNATAEPGEPSGSCVPVVDNTVWYAFVSPSCGPFTMTVSTDNPGTTYDTRVIVWEATGGACNFAGFVEKGCNNDATGGCIGGSPSAASTLTFSGLTQGALHYIVVEGNNSDTGPFDLTVTVEPDAPTAALGFPTSTKIITTWPNTGANNYDTYLIEIGQPGYASNLNDLNYTKTWSNLMPSTQYGVQTKNACQAAGVENFFTPITTITTDPSSCPGWFVGPSCDAQTTNSLTFSWAAQGGALSYKLRYRIPPQVGFAQINGVTTTNYTLTGLLSATTYEFWVQAVCVPGGGGGANPTSPHTFCTTLGVPRLANPEQKDTDFEYDFNGTHYVNWDPSRLYIDADFTGTVEIVNGQLVINDQSNINDQNIRSMNIYPNPASSSATLDITMASAGEVLISVYDVHGKLVKSFVVNAESGQFTYRISLEDMAAGMYNVMVSTGTDVQSTKLAVVR